MNQCIALLRGINVGTAKRVAMADLRELVAALGYTSVRTLLNSGNVVFNVPPKMKGDAAAQIQAGLAAKLGVAARVLVITDERLRAIVAENPLRAVADNPSRFLVGFVHDPSELAKLAPLIKQTWLPDAFAVGSGAAYLWCAQGILENPMLAAAHKLLGQSMTTRNWATVGKLHALLAT